MFLNIFVNDKQLKDQAKLNEMINTFKTLISTKKEATVTKKNVTEEISHKLFEQVIKLSKNPKDIHY